MKLLTRRRKPVVVEPVKEKILLCQTCHCPRPDPWMPCDYCGEVE